MVCAAAQAAKGGTRGHRPLLSPGLPIRKGECKPIKVCCSDMHNNMSTVSTKGCSNYKPHFVLHQRLLSFLDTWRSIKGAAVTRRCPWQHLQLSCAKAQGVHIGLPGQR